MKTDFKGQVCPFCPENGLVKVIFENEGGYLVHVIKGGEAVLGRYFIITKEHIERLQWRKDDWTRWEKELLWEAIQLARSNETIRKILGSTDPWDAFNLSWNQGYEAGQRVKHIHAWVCFRIDGLDIGLDGLTTMVLEQKEEIGRLKDELETALTARSELDQALATA